MKKFSVVFFTLTLLTFAFVGFTSAFEQNKEVASPSSNLPAETVDQEPMNDVVFTKPVKPTDGEGLVYNFHGDYVSTLVELYGQN